jgi:predicted nucleotidyltransferase
MITKETILQFLENHIQDLKLNYHISSIGLIGSFARDNQNDKSDIDLLVEFEPGTEDLFNIKLKLKHYLKSTFNRDIDICREKYLKPYIKDYVLKEVIYV